MVEGYQADSLTPEQPRRWRRRGVALVGAVCLLVGTVVGVGVGTVVAKRSRLDVQDLLEPRNPDERRADVIVFLNPKAAASVETDLTERIRADPGIRAACFYSSQDALVEFRELFADRPEMTDSVTAEVLPPSFRIDVAGDPAAIERIKREYRALAGVREVVTTELSRMPPELVKLLASMQDEPMAQRSDGLDCDTTGRLIVG